MGRVYNGKLIKQKVIFISDRFALLIDRACHALGILSDIVVHRQWSLVLWMLYELYCRSAFYGRLRHVRAGPGGSIGQMRGAITLRSGLINPM